MISPAQANRTECCFYCSLFLLYFMTGADANVNLVVIMLMKKLMEKNCAFAFFYVKSTSSVRICVWMCL